MSGYDSDERIHPPAPSFLSRAPTAAERRRLRRVIAVMPPAPTLVFWPESSAIDGPWSQRTVPQSQELPAVCRPQPPAPTGDGLADRVIRSRDGPAAAAGHSRVRPAVHK